MGFGGISWQQLLIVLVIAIIIFGGKRIRNAGADFGHMLKGFRNAAKELEANDNPEEKK